MHPWISSARALTTDLMGSCARALRTLNIDEDAETVVSGFIEAHYPEGYYEEQERTRETRKHRS